MSIAIENIETIRLRQGIDDVDLRDRVGSLMAEDRVRLSMSGDGKAYETVSVRITSRKGASFRGKLVSKPRQLSLKSLDIGSIVLFKADQVHSIIKCKITAAVSPSTCYATVPDEGDSDNFESPRFVRPVAPTPLKKSRKSSRSRLRVEVDAARRFIQVPVGLANELHQYLRSRRVHSSPPQPYLSDFDCIELDRSIDVKAVQSMLDLWRQS